MRLLLLLCLLAPAAPSLAADALAAARNALLERWPDARITPPAEPLPACAGRLSAEPPGALRDGQAQLRLRCEANPGWTRFVTLGVQRPGPVWVLTRALARGEVLDASALRTETRDLARLAGSPLADATALTGQRARRALPAGTVMAASMLEPPLAIRRGERVTLVGLAAGLEVQAPGEALADAAAGHRIRVRNSGSRRVVEGVARNGNRVEVLP
jgi:flagella basal body P-ring formation protein FlgA